MAVGPIHAVGPASRFRPRFARLIADDVSYTTLSPVDSVAAIGEPAVETDVVSSVARAPINHTRPLSRFNPRVARPASQQAASTTANIGAQPVAGVATVGSPQVIATGSGGYIASRSITRPVSRFRPRVERWAHFAELTGQTIFQSSVESVAVVGDPAVTEEFSLDGGGELPEGWTIDAGSVESVAYVAPPVVSDGGATILAGSVVSNTLFGSPAVYSGDQIRTDSVASVAAIGTPAITVVETTILPTSIASVAVVGEPLVDDGIVVKRGGGARKSLYFVKKDNKSYAFEDEEEAIRFAEEQDAPPPRKKTVKKSLVVPVKPPPEPTAEELAEQAKQAELAAIRSNYERQMRQIIDDANATIAVVQADAEVAKADAEALRMLIEGGN